MTAAFVAVTASTRHRVQQGLAELEDRFVYDIEATLAAAEALAEQAAHLGETGLWMRARLAQANMWRRSGDIAGAARVCWEVNAWAREHGDRPLLARSHNQLSSVYHTLGDAAAGLGHSVDAVGHLDDDSPPRARAAYLMRLGDDLAIDGSIDAARQRYGQAERVTANSGDTDVRVLVLNNLAYANYLAGEPQLSWEAIERLQSVADSAGIRLQPDVLDTTARVQIALGRYAEAERTAATAIEGNHGDVGLQDADSLAEYLLTMATAQRHQGHRDRAQASIERCTELCDGRDLAGVRVRALREQAELYADGGDFARAFHTHKIFYAAEQRLVSAQREAQARTRQVMLEVTEARQDAERFREQARRDPLTGLRNRRHIDEELPPLLDAAAHAGTPLVAAILDLDHFKRINDTCSHEAGDQVLVALAGLLTAAVTTGATNHGSFAARLGGEEFLAVLADVTLDDAVRRLDDLRRDVARYTWRPVTGDLPVTVSIGVAVARAGDTQADLLAHADAALYEAKRGGRDQVRVASAGLAA